MVTGTKESGILTRHICECKCKFDGKNIIQINGEIMINGEKTNNHSIRKSINKIEYKITFKIKVGYYLELLTPEIMKLLGSIKKKITKDENGENMPHLEITEVVLVHCNIDKKDC